MKDIINNLNKSDTWKIQLTIVINYASKNTDGKRALNLKSDNIEIMIYIKAEELFEELFESLLKRYQNGLETSMKGSDFILQIPKIILNRGGSYIDSPE